MCRNKWSWFSEGKARNVSLKMAGTQERKCCSFLHLLLVAVVVVVTINIIILITVGQKVLLRPYRNFICHYQAPPHVSNSPKSVSSLIINCLGHLIWSTKSKRWLHHSSSDLLHVRLLSMCNSVWTVGSSIGVAPLKTASSDVSIFLL